MDDVFARLAAPFPPDAVSWRVGSTTKDKAKGMALAYIDARDVMDRLDEVLGPDSWSDSYDVHGPRVICTLSLRLGEGGDWVSKSDGAGDTAVESEKGAISDAFKRAAVKWGVGRYLYSLPSPWVQLYNGRIADGELPKLEALLRGQKPPPPADPSRAIAGPVKNLGEAEGGGKKAPPSAQAEAQANALRQARNLTELEQKRVIAQATVKGWHAEERAFVKAAYDETFAKFNKTNPEYAP